MRTEKTEFWFMSCKLLKSLSLQTVPIGLHHSVPSSKRKNVFIMVAKIPKINCAILHEYFATKLFYILRISFLHRPGISLPWNQRLPNKRICSTRLLLQPKKCGFKFSSVYCNILPKLYFIMDFTSPPRASVLIYITLLFDALWINFLFLYLV